MAKGAKQRAVIKERKSKRWIFLVSCAVLGVKLILTLTVPHGGWLGADGESYLKGVDAILKGGFSSKDSLLVYWPAGYPILLWLLSLLSLSKMIYLITAFQSICFFLATAFFVEQVRRTRISNVALPAALIIGLDPTLSLSSLAIGYESLVASCMLASVALIINYELNEKSRTSILRTSLLIGLIQGFSTFMQPRGLIIGFVIFLIWGIFHHSWKNLTAIVLLGTCVMLIFPAVLVARNVAAKNGAVISRNLGVTMSIGAGEKATGGYGNSGGVACPPTPPATKITDNQLVKCTISWYLHHPGKAAVLAIKKSVYFWSPWSGPLANGTMARNPWLKIDPIQKMVTNRQGYDLVHGWVGKVISWIWLLSGLALFFIGLGWLWQRGGLERKLGVLAAAPVFLAWLTAIGTIGDHRFRLPTLGLSLFLQVAGYFGLKERLTGGSARSALEPRGRAR